MLLTLTSEKTQKKSQLIRGKTNAIGSLPKVEVEFYCEIYDQLHCLPVKLFKKRIFSDTL